jgi:ABC-type phosphate transport system substrate-binding protein
MPSSDAVKAGSYRPLARPLFLYIAAPSKTVAAVSASKGTSEELSRFVEFATNPERGRLIEELGFVPNGVVGR